MAGTIYSPVFPQTEIPVETISKGVKVTAFQDLDSITNPDEGLFGHQIGGTKVQT